MKLNRGKRISIIVFLLLILIMTFAKDKIEEIVGKGEKKLINIGTIKAKWDEVTSVRGYQDSVVLTSNTDIISYDFNGIKKWSRSIDKNKDTLCLGYDGIYIVGKDKGRIDKFDLDGNKLWSYDTDSSIYTVIENEKCLFIYSKVDENIKKVTVLNENGKKILDKERSKEEILSANVSKNKKNFIVTSMDNGSSELKSKLTYLNKQEDIIWEKDFDEKIIYNVFLLQNENMILVEDKELICINNKGQTLWSRIVDFSLKGIEILDDDRIFILYGDNKSFLEVLDRDGKVDYRKSLNKLYNNVHIYDKDIILLGKNEILGLNNDKINLKYNIKDEAKYIDKFKDKLFIFKEDKLDIFKIENK